MSAINSNIEHIEVKALKTVFMIFLVTLITVCILNYVEVHTEMSKVESYMEQNSEWVKDQHYINNLIHMFFNLTSETNITAAIQRNLNYALDYQIKFDPDLDVNIVEEDNLIRQVKLNTAMVAVQGHLVNLFEFSPIASQLGPLLINYYTYIYPVF